MFVDSTTITICSGKGGNGVIAWRREKFIPKGGPCGGDGGNGGSVYFKPTSQLFSLEDYRNKRIIKAQNGACGGTNNRKGKNGEDLILTVPVGTVVKNARTGEILLDLIEDGKLVKICSGGKGGKGNTNFKSSTHQAPHVCTPGTLGQEKEIQLELKLIADVGLVGMPNAGKSTIVSKVTHLPVKIAPYPFTTLKPNLGILELEDFRRILIADIPGIIEDAHNDRGLGLSFLKHIERTSVLLYVVDISGQEGRDPWEDFLLLRNELKEYNDEMLAKPFLVVLNKTDLEGAEEHETNFRKAYPFDPKTLLSLSALTGEGLLILRKKIAHLMQKQTPALTPALEN
jgi:GTPase